MAFDYKNEFKRYKRYYQSLEPALQRPATRAYTAIIFSFLVISLFGWYAIRPTMQTIVTLQREISDKTELNKKMEEKISALIEAQAAYQTVEQYLPLVDQALPAIPEAPRAIRDLQASAAYTRVAVTNVGVSALPLTADTGSGKQHATASGITEFPLSLSVTGPYLDVKNFLQEILNLRRIMVINSMFFKPVRASESVASASASPPSTQVNIDVKLTLFYL
jgi:Tfp pilus assembly protein PilO